MRISNTSAFFLMLLLFNACKKDKPPTGLDNIYADFLVEHYSTLTSVTASFRMGSEQGELVELDTNQYVLFEGLAMNFDEENKRYKVQTNLKLNYSISWGEFGGQSFKNTISDEALEMEDLPDTLDHKKSYNFFWKDSAPVKQNEMVVLGITSSHTTLSTFAPAASMGGTSIHADMQNLIHIVGVDYMLNFSKHHTPPLSELGEIGGRIHSIFYAPVKEVYIK